MSINIPSFSLSDICRPKVIAVEIKDNDGDVEGIINLKEPSAVAAIRLREKLNIEAESAKKALADGQPAPGEDSNTQFMLDVLALVLSDADGNPLVNSPADRKLLENMPPRVLMALQDPAMKMILGSGSRQEIPTASGDIDATLTNLDDQIAATYNVELGDGPTTVELSSVADPVANDPVVTIPIDGNENLHLDQDPSDPGSAASAVDPSNPFVETAPAPSSHG